MNVNIGGGRGWKHDGWRNFDQADGFFLTPDTMFPVDTGSADIVYSSHCFEHLDDATVDRMLDETWRMLKPAGTFVLKLPDFDDVLRRWRYGDEKWFDAWGQAKVWPTWKNRSVPININTKAAMIFCGWWNDEYGNEFGPTHERRPDAEGAYHGPAEIRHPFSYAGQLRFGRPHDIASSMRTGVPSHGHFNHRNAWSRSEMMALLTDHSLLPVRTGRDVAESWCQIPGINDHRHISMYFEAKPCQP